MPDEKTLLALAPWRVNCAHRIAWRLATTVILTLVFAILLVRSNAEDPRKNHIESQKALLLLPPPPVPDAENAALDYRKAFEAFVSFSGQSEDDPSHGLDRESSFFTSADATKFLASHAMALSNLEAASAKTLCNWNINYAGGLSSAVKLDHLTNMRRAARLLCVRARVRAHKGDHQGAAEDLQRVYTMATHLSGDRILLNSLVMISIRAFAHSTFQAICIFDTPKQLEDIKDYQTVFKLDGHPDNEFLRIAQGELIFQAELLDRLACQAEGAVDAAFVKQYNYNLPIESVTAFGLVYGAERKTQRAVYDEVLAHIKNGERIANDEELIRRNQKGPSFIVAMSMPAFSRVQTALIRDNDLRQCIDVALAVLVYRKTNARDPKALEDLVPQFLPNIPRDRFNNNPFHLLVDSNKIDIYQRWATPPPKIKLDPGALRIYTDGLNGMDEKGKNSQSIERVNYQSVVGDDEVFFLPALNPH